MKYYNVYITTDCVNNECLDAGNYECDASQGVTEIDWMPEHQDAPVILPDEEENNGPVKDPVDPANAVYLNVATIAKHEADLIASDANYKKRYWTMNPSWNSNTPDNAVFACQFADWDTGFSAKKVGNYGKCVEKEFKNAVLTNDCVKHECLF
ncbi:MAG: hypothetical protein ACRC5V_07375 [Aeromonas sp.]